MGRRTVGRSTRQWCRAVERMRASGPAEAFLSLATSYQSGGPGGAQEGSGVRRRGLRHGGGRCRAVKEGGRKGTESDVGKAAGDEDVFIPSAGGIIQLASWRDFNFVHLQQLLNYLLFILFNGTTKALN
jgi:hypothetical protein